MPELPEVQTTVNGINRYAKGLLIKDVWTDYKSSFHAKKDNIANPKYFPVFRKKAVGAKIISASRRGKNILIGLSNKNTVLIHMKMTGHVMYGKYRKLPKTDKEGWLWRPEADNEHLNDPFNRFIHLVFSLSNGKHLVLSDMRKFAKVTMISTDGMEKSSHLRTHGPEPLEKSFGVKELIEAVSKKPNGPIKIVLMNHEVLAGVGNIYSDEILWRVGIHPLEKIKNIPVKKWPLILKAMKEVLKRGIDFGGDSMSDYRNILGQKGKFQEKHNAYQRNGEICSKPGCKGKIIKLKIGGRSAHFCDTHQRLFN